MCINLELHLHLLLVTLFSESFEKKIQKFIFFIFLFFYFFIFLFLPFLLFILFFSACPHPLFS